MTAPPQLSTPEWYSGWTERDVEREERGNGGQELLKLTHVHTNPRRKSGGELAQEKGHRSWLSNGTRLCSPNPEPHALSFCGASTLSCPMCTQQPRTCINPLNMNGEIFVTFLPFQERGSSDDGGKVPELLFGWH